MPKSIKQTIILYITSFFVGIVGLFASGSVKNLNSENLAFIVITTLLIIFLLFFIAKKSNWAKWAYSVLIAIDVTYKVFLAVSFSAKYIHLSGIISFQAILMALSIFILFTPASKKWFLTKNEPK